MTNDMLPTPRFLGRLARISLGAGLAVALLLTTPGELAHPDGLFWALLVVAYLEMPGALHSLVGVRRGASVRWAPLAPAAVAGLLGSVAGTGPWYPYTAWYAYGATLTVLGTQALSFIVAAVLGTPGCEWMALPHLAARWSGSPPRFHACPLGLHRLDALERRWRLPDR